VPIIRESSQTVLSYSNAAVKHCFSCCAPVIESTSMEVNLGNFYRTYKNKMAAARNLHLVVGFMAIIKPLELGM
jgi:hypothetical protein